MARKMANLPIYTKAKAGRDEEAARDVSIAIFLERDDNSRMLPGKGDFKLCPECKKQKRVLKDYIYNLYEKYRVENHLIKICRGVF
mgnify:CR=1 FL=1